MKHLTIKALRPVGETPCGCDSAGASLELSGGLELPAPPQGFAAPLHSHWVAPVTVRANAGWTGTGHGMMRHQQKEFLRNLFLLRSASSRTFSSEGTTGPSKPTSRCLQSPSEKVRLDPYGLIPYSVRKMTSYYWRGVFYTEPDAWVPFSGSWAAGDAW